MLDPVFQTVSPLGFGAFKIGRNQGIKYPRGYDLPSSEEASKLLNEVLDLGINLIDTAPAYGLSEERIGQALEHRRREYLLCSKTGETFEDGRSAYDFSREGTLRSVQRSLKRLRTEALDILLIHSDGRDVEIMRREEVVGAMQEVKKAGLVRFIGLSGKTPEGAREALEWADVIAVEYHPNDRSHEEVMALAGRKGVAVMVKKPLASGKLGAAAAVPFILARPEVCSVVAGSLDIGHIQENLRLARAARAKKNLASPGALG